MTQILLENNWANVNRSDSKTNRKALSVRLQAWKRLPHQVVWWGRFKCRGSDKVLAKLNMQKGNSEAAPMLVLAGGPHCPMAGGKAGVCSVSPGTRTGWQELCLQHQGWGRSKDIEAGALLWEINQWWSRECGREICGSPFFPSTLLPPHTSTAWSCFNWHQP